MIPAQAIPPKIDNTKSAKLREASSARNLGLSSMSIQFTALAFFTLAQLVAVVSGLVPVASVADRVKAKFLGLPRPTACLGRMMAMLGNGADGCPPLSDLDPILVGLDLIDPRRHDLHGNTYHRQDHEKEGPQP